MEKHTLLSLLKAKYKPLDGGDTYSGTYGSIPKKGLFTEQLTNRPSKSWPKAQFLVTSESEQSPHSIPEIVSAFKRMCSGYEKQNQILFLEKDDKTWDVYDAKGILLGHEEFIEALTSKNKNTECSVNKVFLRAMRTKPFLLLAGISGTGKSRLVKQMAFDCCPPGELRKDNTTPGNYCLIEVKPNWHDSTDLLGYESRINGPEYVLTKFVKFLTKAMLYPHTPFFICLDEMNLAPVEQYFAEFLSVLESRRRISNTITTEALIDSSVFKDYEQTLKFKLFDIKQEIADYDGSTTSDTSSHYVKENAIYETLKDHGLRIPENVIVIGTVNMDETTHQFSRKVIDRAMTIEMNLPDDNPFMKFYDSNEPGYLDSPADASLFIPKMVYAADALEELAKDNADKIEWLKKEIAHILTEINSRLEATPFKIAYRVQNELILYFFEQWCDEDRPDKIESWHTILNSAVDQILIMKVLPRIEGDNELLEEPLKLLLELCRDGKYPNAYKKLKEMAERLEKAQFTSFWP
ncbi:MAG: hypothetical protein K2M79_00720 [Muribaculaceae bacterium]|nr:hypothetical protein [Muribaculaceae bacterium]